MTTLVCWVLFPLALTALSLGCGLLLEQVSRIRLPGALLPAAGFSVVLVAAHVATAWGATTAAGPTGASIISNGLTIHAARMVGVAVCDCQAGPPVVPSRNSRREIPCTTRIVLRPSNTDYERHLPQRHGETMSGPRD